LWKYLSKGKHVLVHHCDMKNHEGRSAVEMHAVKSILEWLASEGLTNFKYLETRFDYGNVSSIVRDIEVVYFISGAILRNPVYSSIVEIAVSANAHDESNNPNEKSVVRRREILASMLPRKNFEGYDSLAQLTFPIIHKTKKEIISEMPKELFYKTWFCRRPIAFNSEDQMVPRNHHTAIKWRACKDCTPCRHVIDATN
jgi:hypothetical protein